jgi:hypothetical protein
MDGLPFSVCAMSSWLCPASTFTLRALSGQMLTTAHYTAQQAAEEVFSAPQSERGG